MEVVVWRSEEPYRFVQGRVGSLVYAGKLGVADLTPRDPAFDIAAALAEEPDHPRRAQGRNLTTLLELHIEQGRRLEQAGIDIGVVTAISGATRLRLTLTGATDHSGATPMSLRHDALCAAAEVVLAAEQAGNAEQLPESVATAAILTALPGAMNVIPGRAELYLDIRSTDIASVERMVQAISSAAVTVGKRRDIAVEIAPLTRAAPVDLDVTLVAQIEESARALGYSMTRMASGAGHDVQSVADLARTGMIFVPSRGGISHAPEEYTAPDAILRGIRALAATWIDTTARKGTLCIPSPSVG